MYNVSLIRLNLVTQAVIVGQYEPTISRGSEMLFYFEVNNGFKGDRFTGELPKKSFPVGTTFKFGIDNSRNSSETELIYSENFNNHDSAFEDITYICIQKKYMIREKFC
jgi:hypothetical protein